MTKEVYTFANEGDASINKEVYVFSIEGNELVTLDPEEHCEIRIDITNYDKKILRNYIGSRIFVEENPKGDGYLFAGTTLLKDILQ